MDKPPYLYKNRLLEYMDFFNSIGLLLFFVVCISCSNNKAEIAVNQDNQQQNTDTTSISESYVNKACSLQIEVGAPITVSDTLKLKKALFFLDKALDINANNTSAFTNKIEILRLLGRYKEVLKILDKRTNIVPNFAEGFSYQGFIYERLGHIDSANIKYNQAILAYTKRFDKEGKIDDKIQRAFILSLIDKEEGLLEIESLINKHPNNKRLVMMKELLFDNFDRRGFIDKY